MSAKMQLWHQLSVCLSAGLLAGAAINQARRALEKLGGMSLSVPASATLTPAEQLFVVVNLERTERGLAPVLVLSKSLTAVAQAGARAGRDPAMKNVPRRLPGGGQTVYASANWSGGWVNPLGADSRGCTTTGLAEATWTAGRAPRGCAGGTGTTS